MFGKTLVQAAVAAMLLVAASGGARAFDIEAGPIWDNNDANAKCPRICSGLKWNGQWLTTIPNQMSVCGTEPAVPAGNSVSVPVGPIWNQQDANTKCPGGLAKVTWSGNWATTQPGKMSVCGCNNPPPYPN